MASWHTMARHCHNNTSSNPASNQHAGIDSNAISGSHHPPQNCCSAPTVWGNVRGVPGIHVVQHQVVPRYAQYPDCPHAPADRQFSQLLPQEQHMANNHIPVHQASGTGQHNPIAAQQHQGSQPIPGIWITVSSGYYYPEPEASQDHGNPVDAVPNRVPPGINSHRCPCRTDGRCRCPYDCDCREHGPLSCIYCRW